MNGCVSITNHFRKLTVDFRSDDLHHKSCKAGIIGFSRWIERLFDGHDCLCEYYRKHYCKCGHLLVDKNESK